MPGFYRFRIALTMLLAPLNSAMYSPPHRLPQRIMLRRQMCQTRSQTPLLSELSREELELVLTELESLRSLVSRDVAAAAMLAAREKASIDGFIGQLQDEVQGLGEQIQDDIEISAMSMDEQYSALRELGFA